MLKQIVKVIAYAKAPRATFTARHPLRALKFGAAYMIGKKIFGKGKKARAAG